MDEGSRRAREPLKYFSDIVIACLPVIDLSDFVTNLRTRSQKGQHMSTYVSIRQRTSAYVIDLRASSWPTVNSSLIILPFSSMTSFTARIRHGKLCSRESPITPRYQHPLRQYLYFVVAKRICTFVRVKERFAQEQARSRHATSAILRQYLYFCPINAVVNCVPHSSAN